MFSEDRITRLAKFKKQVAKQLIVSCQALPDEALFGSDIMAKMALAASQGGARAIRANTPVDVKAIKEKVDLPIIGLYKEVLPDFPVIITPTLKHALAIAEAGADIVAIDATHRPHPEGDLADYIGKIHEMTGCLVMADISNYEEALDAEKAGADMVSTTLSGYTPYTQKLDGPDLELIKRLAGNVTVPLIGEGRYHTPEQVKQALEFGATSVVVGGAITRPKEITMRYVKMINA